MSQHRPWLAPYTWDFVTLQNAALCQAKNALHQPTTDGHAKTQQLWNTRHTQPMSLAESVDLCRQCHKMAPFCFYNGNTFTAIIRDVISSLELEGASAYIMRSLAGHIVAGVATEEEVRAFRDLSAKLP